MPRTNRGFTLLEVMVVISITLLVMLMITPIFSVVTRTVHRVEEKLDVYEAARNVLDNFELEVQQAIQNERGELFGIKNIAFTGTAGLDPFCKAGADANGSSKYFFDERSADAVHFLKVRTQSNHHHGDSIRYPLDFHHATTNDFWVNTIEIYSAMLSSNLLYLNPRWVSRTNNRLRDVRAIGIDLNEGDRRYLDKTTVPNPPPPTPPPPVPIEIFYSEPPDCLSQWKANTAPWNCNDDRQEFSNLRYGDAQNTISVMDFDVEYWDEKKKIWREPPKESAIFFRNIPKAIKLTVCVCDYKKRTKLVLSRVIHLPCGIGTGELEAPFQDIPTTPKDTVYCTADGSVPLLDRPKDISILDPWAKNMPSR